MNLRRCLHVEISSLRLFRVAMCGFVIKKNFSVVHRLQRFVRFLYGFALARIFHVTVKSLLSSFSLYIYIYIYIFNVIKVEFDFFNTANNIFLTNIQTYSLQNFDYRPTSVKVVTVYGAFKMNTKLKCLRFECFIDIHVMNRTSYDRLGTRIFSSRADGTLEENIRAVMHNNIFHIFISLIIYLAFENYL